MPIGLFAVAALEGEKLEGQHHHDDAEGVQEHAHSHVHVGEHVGDLTLLPHFIKCFVQQLLVLHSIAADELRIMYILEEAQHCIPVPLYVQIILRAARLTTLSTAAGTGELLLGELRIFCRISGQAFVYLIVGLPEPQDGFVFGCYAPDFATRCHCLQK